MSFRRKRLRRTDRVAHGGSKESSRWCERSVSGGVIGSCDKAPKPRLPPKLGPGLLAF